MKLIVLLFTYFLQQPLQVLLFERSLHFYMEEIQILNSFQSMFPSRYVLKTSWTCSKPAVTYEATSALNKILYKTLGADRVKFMSDSTVIL